MLIIVDQRIPEEAKRKLSAFGEVLEFFTTGITYEAISGHPDVFFCQTPMGLIAAPNTPVEFLDILARKKIPYLLGKKPVGRAYPDTAIYSAVYSDKFLIHCKKYSDIVILNELSDKEFIEVKQGYTRCSLLCTTGDSFITSDNGIRNTLLSKNVNITCVSPEDILLPGFKHGFFGGCCGVFEKKVFISGSLENYNQGEIIHNTVRNSGLEIVELYKGKLIDVGGIFFIEK